MKYLNQFHKETTERKMSRLKELLKNPVPAQKASETQFRLHKELKTSNDK